MTALLRALAAAALVLLATCLDNTGPVAGVLTVSLMTPNSGLDGAAVLVLSGPAVPGSVMPSAGLTLWGGPVQTTTAKVALTGKVSAGTILTLQVDDVNKVRQYHATLQQVAASAGFVQRSLTGYSLAITK